ncbi:uncharacterized protein LOC100901839 [Galendromus occidentalis]|uniref:Uncharacterized protein LOC100901839 n=1 Tax=Galendromus occidentalis TaxID=34638 RepID=A0AAJ7L6U8_9ACAR|nr:uncharacterized protein LOC100901839 [Galendromus occidentalis]
MGLAIDYSLLMPLLLSSFFTIIFHRRRIELRGGGPRRGAGLIQLFEYLLLISPFLVLFLPLVEQSSTRVLRGQGPAEQTSGYPVDDARIPRAGMKPPSRAEGKSTGAPSAPFVIEKNKHVYKRSEISDLRKRIPTFKARFKGEDLGEMELIDLFLHRKRNRGQCNVLDNYGKQVPAAALITNLNRLRDTEFTMPKNFQVITEYGLETMTLRELNEFCKTKELYVYSPESGEYEIMTAARARHLQEKHPMVRWEKRWFLASSRLLDRIQKSLNRQGDDHAYYDGKIQSPKGLNLVYTHIGGTCIGGKLPTDSPCHPDTKKFKEDWSIYAVLNKGKFLRENPPEVVNNKIKIQKLMMQEFKNEELKKLTNALRPLTVRMSKDEIAEPLFAAYMVYAKEFETKPKIFRYLGTMKVLHEIADLPERMKSTGPRASNEDTIPRTKFVEAIKKFHNADPQLYCREHPEDGPDVLFAIGLCFDKHEKPEDCQSSQEADKSGSETLRGGQLERRPLRVIEFKSLLPSSERKAIQYRFDSGSPAVSSVRAPVQDTGEETGSDGLVLTRLGKDLSRARIPRLRELIKRYKCKQAGKDLEEMELVELLLHRKKTKIACDVLIDRGQEVPAASIVPTLNSLALTDFKMPDHFEVKTAQGRKNMTLEELNAFCEMNEIFEYCPEAGGNLMITPSVAKRYQEQNPMVKWKKKWYIASQRLLDILEQKLRLRGGEEIDTVSFFLGLMLHQRRLRGGGDQQGKLQNLLEFVLLICPLLFLFNPPENHSVIETLRGGERDTLPRKASVPGEEPIVKPRSTPLASGQAPGDSGTHGPGDPGGHGGDDGDGAILDNPDNHVVTRLRGLYKKSSVPEVRKAIQRFKVKLKGEVMEGLELIELFALRKRTKRRMNVIDDNGDQIPIAAYVNVLNRLAKSNKSMPKDFVLVTDNGRKRVTLEELNRLCDQYEIFVHNPASNEYVLMTKSRARFLESDHIHVRWNKKWYIASTKILDVLERKLKERAAEQASADYTGKIAMPDGFTIVYGNVGGICHKGRDPIGRYCSEKVNAYGPDWFLYALLDKRGRLSMIPQSVNEDKEGQHKLWTQLVKSRELRKVREKLRSRTVRFSASDIDPLFAAFMTFGPGFKSRPDFLRYLGSLQIIDRNSGFIEKIQSSSLKPSSKPISKRKLIEALKEINHGRRPELYCRESEDTEGDVDGGTLKGGAFGGSIGASYGASIEASIADSEEDLVGVPVIDPMGGSEAGDSDEKPSILFAVGLCFNKHEKPVNCLRG